MILRKDKRKVALLVPAYNEETVIGETLKSLLNLVDRRDIYLVNDGSADKTEEIARKYIANVLTVYHKGKATAMNTAIQNFHLAETYQYLMFMDADTKVKPGFLQETLPVLDSDRKKKIACVVGKVVSNAYNWITLYRLWEYEVAQTIHKKAQSEENAIIVCPGCATIYRAEIFNKIQIPQGTLTEDMDFTFLIHRERLGRIVFVEKAVVITQDPQSFADFIKQIDRWYTGFWQCLSKHNVPWGGQNLDAELALLALEGLYNGLVVLSLVFLIPITVTINPQIILFPFFMDLFLFLFPTLLLTAGRHNQRKIFIYIPQFYFMRMISSLVFFKSFLKVVFGFDFSMEWNKAKRYHLREEKLNGAASPHH